VNRRSRTDLARSPVGERGPVTLTGPQYAAHRRSADLEGLGYGGPMPPAFNSRTLAASIEAGRSLEMSAAFALAIPSNSSITPRGAQ
jgi:hypothetical protein